MKRITDLFFSSFLSVLCFYVMQNAAAPVNSTSELKEEIEDLRRNLAAVWKVVEILNDRLEHLEDDDDVWHCDDNSTDWTNVENGTQQLEQLQQERPESDEKSEKRDSDDDEEEDRNRDDDEEEDRNRDDDEEEDRNRDDEDDNSADSHEAREEKEDKQEGRHHRKTFRGKCRRWMRRGHRRSKIYDNDDDDDDEEDKEFKGANNITAYCNMRPNKALPPEQRADVRGRIYLVQKGEDKLVMNVKVSGLVLPNGKREQNGVQNAGAHGRKHGFHVHEFGNLTNGCESAGVHYNPLNFTHNGPTEPKRHLGDFGNLESDERGIVDKILEFDVHQALSGTHSLVGRSLVIHELEDDLGSKPQDPGSMSTGNSGSRLACCVIHKLT